MAPNGAEDHAVAPMLKQDPTPIRLGRSGVFALADGQPMEIVPMVFDQSGIRLRDAHGDGPTKESPLVGPNDPGTDPADLPGHVRDAGDGAVSVFVQDLRSPTDETALRIVSFDPGGQRIGATDEEPLAFDKFRGDAAIAVGGGRVLDFDDGDRIALDDRFFGLGNGGVDVRAVTDRQFAAAARSGSSSFDADTDVPPVDADGRAGPAAFAYVAMVGIENGRRLEAGDIPSF